VSRLSTLEAAAGSEILELVRWQVALGPRVPGSRAHGLLEAEIRRRLESFARRVVRHEFPVSLRRSQAGCANLIGIFPPRGGRGKGGRTLLLGTHFDTRLQADREADPGRRSRPIPGANDGGSGTAVLLHLLPLLAEGLHDGEVVVVFFDAEDVGDIAGNPYSLGAQRFVEQAPVDLPEQAVILDMVGGRDLRLDLDAHILHHPPSLALTRRLFSLGGAIDPEAFASARGGRVGNGNDGIPVPVIRGYPGDKLRYIISDQYPFMAAGIASCLLIDLDYPQWHTQEDLPEAMAPESLATIEAVLRRFLLPPES
jgi:glutaminyl-peptide cyclotransferase